MLSGGRRGRRLFAVWLYLGMDVAICLVKKRSFDMTETMRQVNTTAHAGVGIGNSIFCNITKAMKGMDDERRDGENGYAD